MTEALISLIEPMIIRQHPGATGIDILSNTPLNTWHPTIRSVQVSWRANGMIHLEHFAVEQSDDGLITGDPRLLERLAETPVSSPRPILQSNGAGGSGLVMEQLSSRTLSDLIGSISMRWELSAAAFSFARALAELHRLDWHEVAPWLADPESLPEDLIDEQVEQSWEVWEEQIAQLPASLQPRAERVLNWLDLRRPVEVSVCLCHGNFMPDNLLVIDDEVSTILSWRNALVTDASYDLALLPLRLRRLSLKREDADLFLQAVFGAYLQSSPRSLGNLPFYMVARVFTPALADALKGAQDEAWVEHIFLAVEQAMEQATRAPWKTDG